MKEKVIRLVREFSRQMSQYHIGAYASSTAFFTFLSLIPMMMVFCSILPYTPLTEATLMGILADVLPNNMVPLSVGIVSEMYDKSGALLSITVLLTLWSAAKGTLALLQGLNVINDVRETRNYIFLRLRACIYTVILLVMLLVLLIIVVFGERIVNLISASIPNIRYLFDMLMNLRGLFVIAVLTLFFCTVFTWLPNEKNRFWTELPGAVFVGLAWYLCSWIFSVYVNKYSGFSTYGSLTTVVVAMIWLYMCFYIVMIGAFINRFLQPANEYLLGAFHKKKKVRSK